MNDKPILDSGAREKFSTGSVRDTAVGKGRFDLLPFDGIEELAKHFEKGAAKYGDNNWKKGQPMSRFLDSGLRHAFKALAGHDDENHLVAACWNLLAALDTRARIGRSELPKELNDIPKASLPYFKNHQTTAAELKMAAPSDKTNMMATIPDPIGPVARGLRFSGGLDTWSTTTRGGTRIDGLMWDPEAEYPRMVGRVVGSVANWVVYWDSYGNSSAGPNYDLVPLDGPVPVMRGLVIGQRAMEDGAL